jgi:hypothetical protein
MSGIDPFPLLASPPWNSSMLHSISIVKGFFQLIYFLRIVVKNLHIIFYGHLLVLLVVKIKWIFSVEEVEEDSVTYESSSDPLTQKDDVGNYINDEIDDEKALDTSCIILGDSDIHCYDTSIVLCSHKDLINYEESDVEGHEQVFPLPSEIVEQQEIYKPKDDILELE